MGDSPKRRRDKTLPGFQGRGDFCAYHNMYITDGSATMISKTTEYALRAMAYLAANAAEPRTARQIAEANDLPSGYVVRVMQLLRDGGLVTAQRGPHGGFLLARSIDRINLLDVVNAVEPIPRIEKCPLGNPAHLKLCPLHRRLDAAMASVEKAFSSTTLAELAAEMKVDDQQCQFPLQPTVTHGKAQR